LDEVFPFDLFSRASILPLLEIHLVGLQKPCGGSLLPGFLSQMRVKICESRIERLFLCC
jgi:hypothetical protein